MCKRCGWDHGVRSTSLDYGDEMWSPDSLAEAAFPVPSGPPPEPVIPARPRDARWAAADDGTDWEAGILLALMVLSAVAIAFSLI